MKVLVPEDPATTTGPSAPSRRQRSRRWSAPLSMSGMIGGAALVVIVAVTIWGIWFLPYGPDAISLADRLTPPSLDHLLGTDELGRDVFSRVVYAARWSLLVGFLSTMLALAIGVTLGLVAGYFGGVVDVLITFCFNWFVAFPFTVLALVMVAALGPSFFNVVLVLGLSGWTGYARVVRAEILTMRESDFVMAAHLSGVRKARLVRVHLLPNVIDSIVVLASLQTATMMLTESFLSFIGLGIQPPTPSWGNMLAAARGQREWWLTVAPGAALFSASLAINLLGDSVRDRLDPRIARMTS